MWWFTSPRIVFGPDALDELPNILERGGGTHNERKRLALVTDQGVVERGFAKDVVALAENAGYEVLLLDDVEPEPSVDAVIAGAARVREFGPRWILGLGGGSAIDAAKALWVLYENDGVDIAGVTPLEPLELGRRASLVAIPTTSGTGAEATWAMVLTDTKNKVKVAPSSRDVVPTFAIVDPRFAQRMPPRLTAGTGLDALAHSLESVVSAWRNDFSEGLGEHAARLVFEWLPLAAREPANAKAREHMHNAATIAGLAFGNAQVGIGHSMGHALGVHFHLHHGRAVGLALPAMIEYSVQDETTRRRYAQLTRRLWPRDSPREDAKACALLVVKVRELRAVVGEPLTLREMGVTEVQFRKALDGLVEHALGDPCTVTSPRVPDGAAFRALFESLWSGHALKKP